MGVKSKWTLKYLGAHAAPANFQKIITEEIDKFTFSAWIDQCLFRHFGRNFPSEKNTSPKKVGDATYTDVR